MESPQTQPRLQPPPKKGSSIWMWLFIIACVYGVYKSCGNNPAQVSASSNQQYQTTVNQNYESVASQPQQIENTVYVTRTGKKFHRAGCRYLRYSSMAINRDEAIREGYTPCSVCDP